VWICGCANGLKTDEDAKVIHLLPIVRSHASRPISGVLTLPLN